MDACAGWARPQPLWLCPSWGAWGIPGARGQGRAVAWGLGTLGPLTARPHADLAGVAQRKRCRRATDQVAARRPVPSRPFYFFVPLCLKRVVCSDNAALGAATHRATNPVRPGPWLFRDLSQASWVDPTSFPCLGLGWVPPLGGRPWPHCVRPLTTRSPSPPGAGAPRAKAPQSPGYFGLTTLLLSQSVIPLALHGIEHLPVRKTKQNSVCAPWGNINLSL